MLQSGKAGLHAYLLDHRWYNGHRQAMRERSMATYSAIYATDVDSLNQLHREYGVTHLLLRHQLYERRQRAFGSRYESDVQAILAGKREFLLARPPAGAVVFNDGLFKVVRLPLEPSSVGAIDAALPRGFVRN